MQFLKKFFCIVFVCTLGTSALADTITTDSWRVERIGQDQVRITLTVPQKLYAYETETGPIPPDSLSLQSNPQAVTKKDEITGETQKVFPGPGHFSWIFSYNGAPPKTIPVRWQACTYGTSEEPAACLFPGEAALPVPDAEDSPRTPPDEATLPPADVILARDILSAPHAGLHPYRLLRAQSGYLSAPEFAAFLRGEAAGLPMDFRGRGFWVILFLAIGGGLLLNLTPCILPLIPVNLAVIGASDAAATRNSRLGRGVLYGGGIAITYGILGLIAVFSGSTFGAFAGFWLFNAAVAVIFLFLALAMFGVFSLDFSRFRGSFRMPSSARLGGVFLLGVLSALLAGACVAPVLVAVLVEASGLVARGNYAGLFLPFALGIGMALPWPFAAAGLALFPRPGVWMVRVKQFLGVLIVLLALYYGWLAFQQFSGAPQEITGDGSPSERMNPAENAVRRINAALDESEKTGKAVFVDFGASWCKNCKAMDAGPMKNPDVLSALETLIEVRVQAETPSEPAMHALLKELGVRGFPAYLILIPGQ